MIHHDHKYNLKIVDIPDIPFFPVSSFYNISDLKGTYTKVIMSLSDKTTRRGFLLLFLLDSELIYQKELVLYRVCQQKERFSTSKTYAIDANPVPKLALVQPRYIDTT